MIEWVPSVKSRVFTLSGHICLCLLSSWLCFIIIMMIKSSIFLELEEHPIYKLCYLVSNLDLFVHDIQVFPATELHLQAPHFLKSCWLPSDGIDGIRHPSMYPGPNTPWEFFEKLHLNQRLHFLLQFLVRGLLLTQVRIAIQNFPES